MGEKRKQVIEGLIKSFERYFDIERYEKRSGQEVPLISVCEFYEHTERYIMSQKAGLGSANREEFLYIFEMEHLDQEMLRKCLEYVHGDAKKRARIGPGHMYTYVTPMFVCSGYEEAAEKELRRYRLRKSFRMGIYGWLEYHTILIDSEREMLFTNKSGKYMKKNIQKILEEVYNRDCIFIQ